jgi:hypothetical protein
MSVKHTHKDYDNMKNKWWKCNITSSGHEAVQDADTKVLPRLADQTDADYQAYKNRATFFNATKRTIEGLRGMIFRKPLVVQVPEAVKPYLEDIDMAGTSLETLASQSVLEVLKLNRAGLFLDYPAAPVEGATQADAKRLNHRPLIKLYDALSITNWKTRTINSITQLSMVVLKEVRQVAKDEFEDEPVVQYRVLDLVEEPLPDNSGTHWVYRVRVMEPRMVDGKEVDVVIEGPYYPKMNNKHFNAIPFQFLAVDHTDWTIGEPPLMDLVEVNLAHFRVSADYEHGCHFTGLPTPVISGYTPDSGSNDKFYIGSMSAWVFPNPSAKASFLEFTGQGLNALKDNLESKKSEMAVLGARMLEAEPSAVQSANTAAIHRGGEQSMLASIAHTVSQAIRRLLKQFCEWAGHSDEDVKFQLNTDFFPMPMDSLTLTAIIAAWQNQAIDFEIMIDNLKRGEIVPVDRKAEDIQKSIKANPPPVEEVPTTPGDRAGNGPNQGAAKGVNTKGGKAANPTQKQLQNS